MFYKSQEASNFDSANVTANRAKKW